MEALAAAGLEVAPFGALHATLLAATLSTGYLAQQRKLRATQALHKAEQDSLAEQVRAQLQAQRAAQEEREQAHEAALQGLSAEHEAALQGLHKEFQTELEKAAQQKAALAKELEDQMASGAYEAKRKEELAEIGRADEAVEQAKEELEQAQAKQQETNAAIEDQTIDGFAGRLQEMRSLCLAPEVARVSDRTVPAAQVHAAVLAPLHAALEEREALETCHAAVVSQRFAASAHVLALAPHLAPAHAKGEVSDLDFGLALLFLHGDRDTWTIEELTQLLPVAHKLAPAVLEPLVDRLEQHVNAERAAAKDALVLRLLVPAFPLRHAEPVPKRFLRKLLRFAQGIACEALIASGFADQAPFDLLIEVLCGDPPSLLHQAEELAVLKQWHKAHPAEAVNLKSLLDVAKLTTTVAKEARELLAPVDFADLMMELAEAREQAHCKPKLSNLVSVVDPYKRHSIC